MANATNAKLDEARKRWGMVAVHTGGSAVRPLAAFPRRAALRLTTRGRVPRVTEQVRDISAYRLER